VKAEITRGISLADAAYAAGFADQSHMTRHFKSRFGLTPGRLRRALRIGSGRTCSHSHRGTAIGGEGIRKRPTRIAPWDHTPRTTVNGATWPFPVGLAKVGNPHPNQTVQKSILSERNAGPNSFGFFVA
jgi:hypothetical protein